jgi:hypothetical protein
MSSSGIADPSLRERNASQLAEIDPEVEGAGGIGADHDFQRLSGRPPKDARATQHRERCRVAARNAQQRSSTQLQHVLTVAKRQIQEEQSHFLPERGWVLRKRRKRI